MRVGGSEQDLTKTGTGTFFSRPDQYFFPQNAKPYFRICSFRTPFSSSAPHTSAPSSALPPFPDRILTSDAYGSCHHTSLLSLPFSPGFGTVGFRAIYKSDPSGTITKLQKMQHVFFTENELPEEQTESESQNILMKASKPGADIFFECIHDLFCFLSVFMNPKQNRF